MENINLISIIGIAFLGSFGHCIGMCGGIVMAYSSIKITPNSSKVSKSIAHLLYSLGRVTTYSVLGVMFGYIGSVMTYSNTAKGILFLIAGLAMLIAGLSLMGKMKSLKFMGKSLSDTAFYRNTFAKIMHSNSNYSFYLLGILNGFLPCGFVYFSAITAASTASPLYGALVMAIFGLSTIPAMFGLGFLTTLSLATSFRNTLVSLASIAVIFYGVFTMYNGYKFINATSQESVKCH